MNDIKDSQVAINHSNIVSSKNIIDNKIIVKIKLIWGSAAFVMGVISSIVAQYIWEKIF